MPSAEDADGLALVMSYCVLVMKIRFGVQNVTHQDGHGCNHYSLMKEDGMGEFNNSGSIPEILTLPCLNCGRLHKFDLNSYEALGYLNVFCKDSNCEDEYAARL